MLMIYVWEFYSICIKSCTRNIEQDNAIEKHVRFVNSVMFLVVSLFWNLMVLLYEFLYKACDCWYFLIYSLLLLPISGQEQ